MLRRLDIKKRFSEEQIIGFLGEAEAGLPIKELCRRHGFSEASYYLWRSKFGGMSVPATKHRKSRYREVGYTPKVGHSSNDWGVFYNEAFELLVVQSYKEGLLGETSHHNH